MSVRYSAILSQGHSDSETDSDTESESDSDSASQSQCDCECHMNSTLNHSNIYNDSGGLLPIIIYYYYYYYKQFTYNSYLIFVLMFMLLRVSNYKAILSGCFKKIY